MVESLGWLLLIPILLLIVVIHEAGHFLLGKFNGVHVKEFGLGFPPRLFGVRFSPRGTIYSVNAIPLGGFVSFLTDDQEHFAHDFSLRDSDSRVFTLSRTVDAASQIRSMLALTETSGADQISRSAAALVTFVEAIEPEHQDQIIQNILEFERHSRKTGWKEGAISDASQVPFVHSDLLHLFGLGCDQLDESIDRSCDQVRNVIDSLDYAVQSDLRRMLAVARVYRNSLGHTCCSALSENDCQPRLGFNQRVPSTKLQILFAGSVVNVLFALALFTSLFVYPRDVYVGDVEILSVIPNSPADLAGVEVGDRIRGVNDEPTDNHVHFTKQIMMQLGKETELQVIKDQVNANGQESQSVNLVPRMTPPKLTVVDTIVNPQSEVSVDVAKEFNPYMVPGDTLSGGAVGIAVKTLEPQKIKRRESFAGAFGRSFGQSWEYVVITRNAIIRWATGGDTPAFSGPIGVAHLTGKVAKVGVYPLLQLTGIFSLSIGILNLLPIPALDGGRISLVVVEWIRKGKTLSAKTENSIHFIGFVLIISFILMVSYFDLAKILD